MASKTQQEQTILGVNTRFGSLEYKGLTECDFDSGISFLDYDAVIIDTQSIVDRYNYSPGLSFNGKSCLALDDSLRLKEDFAKTKAQIVEFLKQGRIVFVLLEDNTDCFVHTGRKKVTGTGKSAQTTSFVEKFDFLSFLPISLSATMVRGEKFDMVCPPPYSSFFQTTRNLFYYAGYFSADKKTPLLTIAGCDKVISAVFECEKGKIVILPHPCDMDNYETEEEWMECGKAYLDALFELSQALLSGGDEFVLPLWTNCIKVLNEQDEEIKLEKDKLRLQKIEEAIQKRKESIKRIARKKLLLAASGIQLEEVVKETLQEIGFTLHDAEPGRSDIVASYGGVDVVAEIKGVSKSAAERHAAQLEKWASQFMEEKGHAPKAILFVNGYCNTSLAARTEEVFPDQMLKYCKARKHALITTSQLLCLYIEIKNNPSCAKERIEELLSCSGRYQRYLDLENFITVQEHEVCK